MNRDLHPAMSIPCLLILCLGVSCINMYRNQEKTVHSKPLYENPLSSLDDIEQAARSIEILSTPEGKALQLDGVVLFPLDFVDGKITVEILAEKACYPGILFHWADSANYELVYAVPHVSGQPDAVQYDPVFNFSNTWQLYNGPAFQKNAIVPMNTWFTLTVIVRGDKASIQVNEQTPLVVETLAHGRRSGRVGLWSYKTALFRNLKIDKIANITAKGILSGKPEGALDAWETSDGVVLKTEANGVLNLNRYVAPSPHPVRVHHYFELEGSRELQLGIGFSDEVQVFLDSQPIFSGANTFKGFTDELSRGWVVPGLEKVNLKLAAGRHELAVEIKVTEPFGWGMIVTLEEKNQDYEEMKN